MIKDEKDTKRIIEKQNIEIEKNKDILESIKNYSTDESKQSLDFYKKKNENSKNYSLNDVYILYNNYMTSLENSNNNPLEIKNSFDSYINLIYSNYVQKIDSKTCKRIQKSRSQNQNFNSVKFDPIHRPIFNKKSYKPEFYHFFKLLEYIWKHKELKKNDLYLLAPCKTFILRSLILRKFEVELDLRNSSRIKDQINDLKFIQSKKRVEENLKFLLKKFFKFLQSYKYQNSEEASEKIYTDFFKDLITKSFYNKIFIVQKNSKRKVISIKKINNAIMKILAKSEPFVYLLKLYCNEYLLKEYNLEISWKIFMLMKKWNKYMKSDEAEVLSGICFDIENDKKFKLPWTINEIEESVKQIFDNINN